MDVHRSSDPGLALTRIGSWILAIVVFVAVLELCARVEDRVVWGAPMVGAYSFDAIFGADSIGWRPRPGGGYRQFSINAYGFRGPEVAPEPGPGTVRVVVLGASESFGQAESPGSEYPRALETTLTRLQDDASVHYEVLNAAIPGMSLPRMHEYFDRWVRRFSPDVAVVYPSPGFYLDDTPPADSIRPRNGGFTHPEGGFRLRSRLRSALAAFLPDEIETWLKRRGIRRTREQHEPNWPWTTVPEKRLELYETHLEELLRGLQNAGVETFVVTHVSAIDRPLSPEDESLLVGWQRFHPRADGHVILEFEEEANARLRAVAERVGATVVDAAAELDPEATWFSDHQHFTDLGAGRMATVIAQSIKEASVR